MAKPTRPPTDRAVWISLALLGAGVAAVTLSLPTVQMLGTSQFKVVVFHGASTWANLGTFSVAALLGMAFLATRKASVNDWERAFRDVSLPLWLFNSLLGLVSAMISWSGFTWPELMREPRLQATFWILLGAAVIAVADSMLERPWLTALLDVALGAVLWYLILSASPYLHPDNPMRSPDTDVAIKVRFFVMAAGLLAFWTLVVSLVRSRIADGRRRVSEEAEASAAITASVPDEA